MEIVRELVGGAGKVPDRRERTLAAQHELLSLLDQRGAGLRSHAELVSRRAMFVARAVGLPSDRIRRVGLAGLVHDVGKVILPDSILARAGPLTAREWAWVHRHPEHGAWLVADAGLDDVAEWVLTHHERVDGRGYPHARVGSDIPLEGRILAVADAYEAMTCDRVYRWAMTHEEACAELQLNAGTQFDEHIVEAFLMYAAGCESPADRAEPI